MKYSVLTCNFNDYEIIAPPPAIDKPYEVEWVCVTNDSVCKYDGWKTVNRPDITNFLYVKHHPFEFVSNDVCIWFDGSYKIEKDFTEVLIKPFIESEKEMIISLHDTRYNIYEELAFWMIGRGLAKENALLFYEYLVRNNYHGGTLFQTSFFAVKKTPIVNNIFENVSKLEKFLSVNGDYRDDQTTMSYVIDLFYRKNPKIALADFGSISNNMYFHRREHHSNNLAITPRKHNICWEEQQNDLIKLDIKL